MRIAALTLLVVLVFAPGCTAIERTLELHGFIHKLTPEHSGKSVEVRTGPIITHRHPQWPLRTKSEIRTGRGAVIAKDLILTVKHVVVDAKGQPLKHVWIDPYGRGTYWVQATVEEIVPSVPEAIVLLRVALNDPRFIGFPGFDKEDYYAPSAFGSANVVETARGPYKWLPNSTVKGDSGSPVVDKYGKLVGLVWGTVWHMPVYVTLHEEAWITIKLHQRAKAPQD